MQFLSLVTQALVCVISFSTSQSFPSSCWMNAGTIHVRHCTFSQQIFQPFGLNRVLVANAGPTFAGWELLEIGEEYRMFAIQKSFGYLFMSFTLGGTLILVPGEVPTGSLVDLSDSRLFRRKNLFLSKYQYEVLRHVGTQQYVYVNGQEPTLTTDQEQATPLCYHIS